MKVEIETLQADSPDLDRTVRGWCETANASEAEQRLDIGRWRPALIRKGIVTPRTDKRYEAFVARDPGDTGGADDAGVVGAGWIAGPQLENTSSVMFGIGVHPRWTRRGIGSALYEHVVARALAVGRTHFLTFPEAAPDRIEHAAIGGFLRRRGFEVGLVVLAQRAPLPVPEQTLAAIDSQVAEHSTGYRLVGWTDRCPDEYAEQFVALKGRMYAEMPMGEMRGEPERWDVPRLRAEEARAAEIGSTEHVTVAVAEDGSLAGHTEISVFAESPDRASQGDTLVLAAHRGRRLGLALKAANLRRATSAHLGLTHIDTGNAEMNGPMLAVNRRFGFVPRRIVQHWQLTLEV